MAHKFSKDFESQPRFFSFYLHNFVLLDQVQEETWLEHQSGSVELRSQRLRTPPAHNNKLLTTKLLQATFMGHVHFSTFPSLYEEDNNNNNVIVVIIIFKQTITMIISK